MGRTMAVVLFTDLVGSTELRGRLGEEAADELRRRHDQLLAQAVEANNGSVVKGLGDGIMATFAGAADAVAAAVAIQQGIDRLNRTGKATSPLSVRVGLSAGDVAFEDDDVHGTPVIEAARLCAAAAGGEILAAEVVRVLAGASTEQSYVSVGPLELKGLDHPVAAVRVEWEPAVVSSIPMPQLLTDVGRIFVGRDAELERLGQLWKEAAAGERRVALLAGEPGVGKTRLASELATRAHEEGGVVLAGRCDEDLGVPYQPFVEALRHFIDHSQPAELTGRLGRYGGELTRLVPELGERVPDLHPPLQSDPETERYRLFDAVAAWLSAACLEEPLLLVLDDLQWAAKPTLLLLRHIVRASDARRLLILGTYRDSELTYDHPLVELVADLGRERGLERLPLSGLDDLGVAAFVEQASGRTLDEEGRVLARAVYQETEGNPFFVREVLRHLAETGAVEWREGGWTTRVTVEQLGIPEGVRDVVGRRLSRLSVDTSQALRVAAVVGAEFEVDVVQAAGGFREEALLGALEEAGKARLLSEASATRFRFSHALVRATLYESLTAARKVALHRKVAEAIETVHQGALDDHLPALAHHWARVSAPAADTARAVEYATRAGDRALGQLAHDEAVTYYRQALELLEVAAAPPTDSRRVELLISLGQAQLRAGDPEHRQTLLDAAHLAQQAGNADALSRAALANWRGLYSRFGTVDTDRVAVLERALATSGQNDSPVRARLLANLTAELAFSAHDQHPQELSAHAVAMARRLHDPSTLAHVLASRFGPLLVTAERHQEMIELVQLANRLDDPALQFWSRLWRSVTALAIGDVAGCTADLNNATRLASELGQPTMRWLAAVFHSGALRRQGRLEDAESLAREALDIGQAAGIPDTRQWFGGNLFWIRYDQGRLDELVDRYERAAARPQADPPTLQNLALIYCELGRAGDARHILGRLVVQGATVHPANVNWIYFVSVLAAICAGVGNEPLAVTLHRQLTPHGELIANVGTAATGAVHHHLALLSTSLGQLDQADSEFKSAAATHERLGAPTWLARTRLEWARMLLIRRQPGDADRARELLGRALDSARELGLANVERRAVELLETV
jgi:class 3 adenylate cyclase/tetratricopeptide (TPR) repeat protein